MATTLSLFNSRPNHCQLTLNGAMEKETQRSKSDLHRKRKATDGSFEGDNSRLSVSAGGEPATKKRKKQPTSQLSPGSTDSISDSGVLMVAACVSPRIYNENYLLRKAQQKASMQRPKVFLTVDNTCVHTSSSPLYIVDLQTLLVFTLFKGIRCSAPRWCCVKRTNKTSSVVLVALKHVSIQEFEQHMDCFPFLAETFSENLRVQMVNPSEYFSSFDFDMYAVPVAGISIERIIDQWCEENNREEMLPKPYTGKGAVTSSATGTHTDTDMVTATNTATGTDNDTVSGTPTGAYINNTGTGTTTGTNSGTNSGTNTGTATSTATGTCTDTSRPTGTAGHYSSSVDAETEKSRDGSEAWTLSRTDLLLSVSQMAEENYPLPFDKDDERYPEYLDFVFSKKAYAPVTANSPLFAVDCEMCLTTSQEHELARVSMVNEENEVIYDELVKPHNAIINHLTKYSGITEQMLAPVTKRLEDVQKEISELLPPDAILCGQSLGNDLRVLKMFHQYVIDTSVIYNLSGNRKMKCSLRRLAWEFLGRVIQDSTEGHSSAEDAQATMDLVKLKLSKSLEFGDAVLGEINNQYMLPGHHGPSQMTQQSCMSTSTPPPNLVKMRSLFVHLYNRGVSACQIGGEKLVSSYREEPGLKCLVTDSDKQASKEAAKASQEAKFTWVQFSAFADLLTSETQPGKTDPEGGQLQPKAEPSEDEKRKVLKKLDRHVKKLVTKLQEKCLVAVVMTGNNSGEQHLNAVSFLHIT